MPTKVGMAAVSLTAEYALVREAIQTLTSTGAPIVSFSVDGVQVTYAQNQLTWLQDREEVLAKRINARNIRKRTLPDFT
jgi:hypothetical protein